MRLPPRSAPAPVRHRAASDSLARSTPRRLQIVAEAHHPIVARPGAAAAAAASAHRAPRRSTTDTPWRVSSSRGASSYSRPAPSQIDSPRAMTPEEIDALYRRESGADPGDADPPARRLRRRRGGAAGSRSRPRSSSGRARARPTSRSRGSSRPPSTRRSTGSGAAASTPRSSASSPRSPRSSATTHGADDDDRADPGRSPAPPLHVLPSGARDRRPGRARAPHARRPHHRGDRARLPRAGRRRSRSASCARRRRSATPTSRIASPTPHDLPERLEAVMAVVYLIFTEGHAATYGDAPIRADLCAEAIRLARLLVRLFPDSTRGARPARAPAADRRAPAAPASTPRATSSRSRSRTGRAGTAPKIDEGRALLDERAPRRHARAVRAAGRDRRRARARRARRGHGLGRDRDALRAARARSTPSPVVELNRAIAVAMAEGAERGLALLDALEARGELDDYHLLAAARADLLRRAGRRAEAAASYRARASRSPPTTASAASSSAGCAKCVARRG